METKNNITRHIRARAFILNRGFVLLTKHNKAPHAFLPGGRVEIGESLITTIEREFMEEMGIACNVGNYLGAIEHAWTDDNGSRQCEINHIFSVTSSEISPDANPPSLEAPFTYFWVPIEKLAECKLKPEPLRHLIRRFCEGDTQTWWASTMY